MPEQSYILSARVEAGQRFYAIRCRFDPEDWYYIALLRNYGRH